ncbi:MAG TPA: ATP-binding protein [Saprospiraceae bacterium]|nr:ATP-binding protein [Saprospiraceae bacterium]HMQ82659.1 ATP-binding protein [Saprospiraceae bacterium]
MNTHPLGDIAEDKSTWNADAEHQVTPLLAEIERLKKDLAQKEFIVKRLSADKAIALNILKATIGDLEKSKLELEKANEKLSLQHEELLQQKKIIEENLSKLEISFQELEQFSYIASHDLRSPLRTIAGFAQLLKRRYSGYIDKDADEFIEFIVSGVHHMDNVINALLDYSKVGRTDEGFQEVCLEEILDIVKFNLSDELTQSQATICYDGLPCVRGHKSSLVQLFQNLISNAIKYRSDALPHIHISCKPITSGWEFQVKDNGVGLDVKYQNKAFFPFQRLTDDLNLPGIGIGLSICKKIVKMHKGDIFYTGVEGGGTTFIFTIQTISNS